MYTQLLDMFKVDFDKKIAKCYILSEDVISFREKQMALITSYFRC